MNIPDSLDPALDQKSTVENRKFPVLHFERDDSRLNTAVAVALLALVIATPILIALANAGVAAIAE